MRDNSDAAPRFLLLWEGAYAGRVDELVGLLHRGARPVVPPGRR